MAEIMTGTLFVFPITPLQPACHVKIAESRRSSVKCNLSQARQRREANASATAPVFALMRLRGVAPGEPGSAQQPDLTWSATSHATECGFSARIPGFCGLE